MTFKLYHYAQVFAFSVISTVIACSPTRFSSSVAPDSVCDASTTVCVVTAGITNITQPYKIGAGKVDILFVNDNSASMAIIQQRMAQAFGGFIERLDLKEIDYKIAMVTTDMTKVIDGSVSNPLITFGNNSSFLTKNDSNRVSHFNGAIVRQETAACESMIKSYYNTYGSGFQSQASYAAQYNAKCASSDERGIFAANYIVKNNTGSFLRSDAHLNIILISNEDVRSGQTSTFITEDRATNLTSTVNSTYPGKFWNFNSIITKTSQCAQQQVNEFGVGNAIGANIGTEYAALSASAAINADGNPAPRGQIIDICQANYSTNFQNIAAKVAESARLLTLKCNPLEAPTVTLVSNPNSPVAHQWNGGNQISFNAGSEGIAVNIAYRCQVGGAQ